MANNKWLVALKAKNTPHNTPTTLREADNGDTPAGGEIGQTPEKPCQNRQNYKQ